MASTRNKNTPGNYVAEQNINKFINNYGDYTESSFYGVPQQSYFAGNGLVGMKTAHRNLSENYCDVESFLFGIGSTNLVNPQTPITPKIIQQKSLNICDRTPLIMPEEFVPLNDQRPEYRVK